MKKILFIYKYLPQYRLDFFQQLRKVLLKQNIEMQLIYGKSNNINILRKDEIDIEWAKFIPNRSFKLGSIELVWQPCLRHLKDIDLVILQPESKLILTYYLAFARNFSKYKLGFWGHGRNMQAAINSPRNKFQRLFFQRKCDHWFTYTAGGEKYLQEINYPEKRITVINNAIDTVSLRRNYAEINDPELNELKELLGINTVRTGIFCGAMYPDKKLDFLIETCHRVKNKIPDFHMILIGSGIDSCKAHEASNSNNWIHYVGSKFGIDRIKYFKISSIQIMPGVVGLGILDSFALETPIITTNNPFHGPEIEYLENEINGIMTSDNIDDYSTSVIEVLNTGKYLELIEGCKLSAERYTVESMVENFKNGILKSLNNEKNA